MENEGNTINNSSSAEEIVKKILTLIANPALQELFSVVNQNPWMVDQLNIEGINNLVDILYDKDKQSLIKDTLKELVILKDILTKMWKIYDDHPSTPTPVFSTPIESEIAEYHETQPWEKKVPFFAVAPMQSEDPNALTVEDMFHRKISDLEDEDLDYKSKITAVDTFSHFMLVDILKYTSHAMKIFLATLKEQQLQYKICKDFMSLERWKRELLSQSILEKYPDRSKFLSGMLKEKNIPDSEYIVLHRNILDGLIESHQKETAPESTFYYLSGIKDDATISVDFNCFGSINDLTEDPALQKEIFDFNVKNQSFSEELNKIDSQDLRKEMTDKHNEERRKLTKNIKPYIDKILSYRTFEIMDLLPEQRNYPASFIEPNKWLAIPVAINGINKDLKRKVYLNIFLWSEGSSDVPRWFDIWYLVRWSSISIQNNAVDISQWYVKSGDIYPVLLYNEVAIILKDFTQLENIVAKNQAIATNNPENPDTFKEIFAMFSIMIQNNNQKNIYDELTNRTKSSIRTDFRSKYK